MKIHSVVLYLKAEVHYISVVVCGNCVVLGSLLLFVKYLCFVCMHDFGLNQQLCAMRWHFFFFSFFCMRQLRRSPHTYLIPEV